MVLSDDGKTEEGLDGDEEEEEGELQRASRVPRKQ
jgi:hypothetical protein